MLSVVMPVYNQERYIDEAVQSVLAQTFGDFELIVCDDGSSDRTVEIVRSYADRDTRVRLITHPNIGAAQTMNDGIRQSSGEWIACMHGDDVMFPRRLERQLAFVRENPDIALTSCMVRWIDESGRTIGYNRCNLTDRQTVRQEIAANRVLAFPHPGTMFSRPAFEAAGGYRQFSFPTDDLDLWNRMAYAGTGVLVQPEVLLGYRVHANSTSTLKARQVSQHIRWVEACIRARRSAQPEPSVEAFLASRRTAGLLSRLNDARIDQGHGLYQVALAHYSGRRLARAATTLTAAVALRPEAFLPRVLARLVPLAAADVASFPGGRGPEKSTPRSGMSRPAAKWDAMNFDPGQPQRDRRRVLVSAYAISPARGSEPGMGWNICRELAAYHDVTVLCAPGNPGVDARVHRTEIAEWEMANGPVPGLTLEYVDPPILSRLFQRERELYRRTLYYCGYASWQRAAYGRAAALHRERPFDLMHQLNITGYREPGYLWKLPVPFVWGPVGGAADIPRGYFRLMGRADRLFYGLRNLCNTWQKHVSRRCRRAARRSAHIWAIGRENARMVRETWGMEADDLLESGTAHRREARVRVRDPSRRLRLVWSGLHIGRKALPILLHALARLKLDASQLPEVAVLGAGPETARWQQLAWALGIAPLVRWTGKLPLAQALAEVSRADCLVFTSLQEGTPHAVLEALSLGLPVICHDACGMGAAVTGACGMRIPMRDPRLSIELFADAIRRLALGSIDLSALSAGALSRARELSWSAKARQIADIYDRVTASALDPRRPLSPSSGPRQNESPLTLSKAAS